MAETRRSGNTCLLAVPCIRVVANGTNGSNDLTGISVAFLGVRGGVGAFILNSAAYTHCSSFFLLGNTALIGICVIALSVGDIPFFVVGTRFALGN